MVSFSDILYFNLLRKAGAVVLVLGIIVAIIVVTFYVKWINNISDVKDVYMSSCQINEECFEWCGKCRSIATENVCMKVNMTCACSEQRCKAVS